jgi:hypothetical protein
VSRRAELLLALVAFLVLSILMTWPLVVDLGGQVPSDPVDPVFTSWIMAWGPEGLSRNPLKVFDSPMFYPEPLTLALSENLLGLSVPLSPLWFLTRNPALMNNVAFLLSFTLNGFFAYLLVRNLKAPPLGAGVAGFAYAFAPYRIAQISHLHVEATFWIPLLLLLLARMAETPTIKVGAGAGLVGALQVWTSINSGVVAAVSAALTLPVLLWIGRRHLIRFVSALVGAGIVAGLLVVPLYIVFTEARSLYGVKPSVEEAVVYSAEMQSFLTVPPSNILLGEANSDLRFGAFNEKTLYPGGALVVLALIGAVRLRRSNPTLLAASAILLLGCTVFVFGPGPGLISLPYRRLVDAVPLLLNLRVPTRIWPVAVLALATPAAFAFIRGGRLLSILAVALFFEYLSIPIATVAAPSIPSGYSYFEGRQGVILEIPAMRVEEFEIDPNFQQYETRALYRQTSHWLPIVNGLSATFPEGYLRLMQGVGEFPEPWTWDRLRRVGVRWVVIHPEEVAGTPWEGINSEVDKMEVVYRSRDLLIVTVPDE